MRLGQSLFQPPCWWLPVASWARPRILRARPAPPIRPSRGSHIREQGRAQRPPRGWPFLASSLKWRVRGTGSPVRHCHMQRKGPAISGKDVTLQRWRTSKKPNDTGMNHHLSWRNRNQRQCTRPGEPCSVVPVEYSVPPGNGGRCKSHFPCHPMREGDTTPSRRQTPFWRVVTWTGATTGWHTRTQGRLPTSP